MIFLQFYLVIPVNNKYYIIEAKVNESAKKAIEQIEELYPKGTSFGAYVPQLQDWKEIIKVWVNWNKKKKKFDIDIKKHK